MYRTGRLYGVVCFAVALVCDSYYCFNSFTLGRFGSAEVYKQLSSRIAYDCHLTTNSYNVNVMSYEEDTPSMEEPQGLDRALMATSQLQVLAQARVQAETPVEGQTIRVTTFGHRSFTYHDIDWYEPEGSSDSYPRLTVIPIPSSTMECFAPSGTNDLAYMPLVGDATIRGQEGIDEMADRLEGLIAELQQPGSTAAITLIEL